MKIKFLDLKAQYDSIKQEIQPAMQAVLDKCDFIMGEDVKKIEEEIAAYCQAKFGIACASGTDALVLALWALDLKPGDEIITTPFTFIATTEAVSKTPAKIVFADIDEKTFNIDPEEAKRKITPRTKAIIPVHLYGHAVDIDPIMELAKKHNLVVLEDCAQAIGAEYKGKRVGSIGDAGCLSFFPSKNLGCYGDGGMVVTNNETLAKKVRVLRVHGCETKYYHLIDGFNSRLDTLQAAVLRIKLKYLAQWNAIRHEKFLHYNELFNTAHTTIIIPLEQAYARHVGYAYTICVQRRAELMEYLKNNGIPSMIYYPVPLHLQEVYKNLGYKKGDFPVSEKLSDEVLSLPIYPELTDEQQKYIVEKIGEFYRNA